MKLYRISITKRRPMMVRADHLTGAMEVARQFMATLPSHGVWDITKVVYCGQDSDVVDSFKVALMALAAPATPPPVPTEPRQPNARELRRAARAADPVVRAQAAVHRGLRDLIAAARGVSGPDGTENTQLGKPR